MCYQGEEIFMSEHNIPVIDVGLLRERDLQGSREAARQIGQACRDIGFFYVRNHGISDVVIADTFKFAEMFFSLPLEEKMKLSMERNSKCFRGYAPVLSELADGKRNSYELMEFSVEFDEHHPDVLAGKPMHGPNLWPDIPGYRAAINRYIAELNGLGFDLMRGIAINLGLNQNFFEDAFNRRSFWQFRTTHYPEPDDVIRMVADAPQDGPVADIEVGDYSCGAHTDYGCLTILLANNPGLQVRNRDGEWFDAPAIPGAYICNIGDMLQYWTGNLYVATLHRVLTDQSRISLPFFFQPDYETIVQPFGGVSEGRDKDFPPIQYGPYAFEKYKGIYPNCRVA